MVYIIMVQWCVIGDGLILIILSWYIGVLLVMIILSVLLCVIGDGLYYHGTVVCYW